MEQKLNDAEILKRYLDEKGHSYSWLSVSIGKHKDWATRLKDRKKGYIPPDLKDKIEKVLNKEIFSTKPPNELIEAARAKQKTLQRFFEDYINNLDKTIASMEIVLNQSELQVQDENNIQHLSINQ